MLRDPRAFTGVSGGRAAIAAQLEELDTALGSAQERGVGAGPSRGAFARSTSELYLAKLQRVSSGIESRDP